MMEDGEEGTEGERPTANQVSISTSPGSSTLSPGGEGVEDVARRVVDDMEPIDIDGDDVARKTGDKVSTGADEKIETTTRDEIASESKNSSSDRNCDAKTAEGTSTGRGFLRRRNKQEKGISSKESRETRKSGQHTKKEEERLRKHSKMVVCIFACCCVQPSE